MTNTKLTRNAFPNNRNTGDLTTYFCFFTQKKPKQTQLKKNANLAAEAKISTHN